MDASFNTRGAARILAYTPYPILFCFANDRVIFFGLCRFRAIVCGSNEDFLTANEGDGREYGDEDDEGFYTDEIRVEDLAEELGVNGTLYGETMLGRLKVTKIK